MVKVRLLQVESNENESPSARIHRVLESLPHHLANSDLLVLPELWTIHAFNLEAVQENALSLEDELFKNLSLISKTSNKWLHAGSFPVQHQDGSITNSAIAFDEHGDMKIIYSKIHLFGFVDGERKYLSAGSKIAITNTPLGKTGISICYDLRFPELFREQTNRGATSFVISAGWPTKRVQHWTTLLQARAIENQSYVVASCGRGTANSVELAGQSMVVDPTGKILAHGNLLDEYVDAELDLELVTKWRSEFPVLQDRRDVHNL